MLSPRNKLISESIKKRVRERCKGQRHPFIFLKRRRGKDKAYYSYFVIADPPPPPLTPFTLFVDQEKNN